jgi:16S rRNA (guanine527-N7)-methyltransferase
MTPTNDRNAEIRLLRNGFQDLGLEPEPSVLRAMLLFIDELVRWNRRTNLIGTSDREQIIVRHVLDSLTAYPLLPRKKGPILDLGAGAGFPSLPLAMVDPSLSLAAVEKRSRRAAFLRAMGAMLGLENLRVIERDVRDVSERFGVILARAVGELSVLYTLAARVIKEGAVIIAYKGRLSEIDKEMKGLEEKVQGKGDCSIRIQRVQVPHLSEEERNIVIIEMAG